MNNTTSAVIQPASLQIGSIFVCSWGYGQTNITFFKVVSFTEKSVTVVELNNIETHDTNMSGKCVPDLVNIPSQTPKRKKLNWPGNGGRPTFKPASYSTASLWHGQPCSFSSWN